MELVEGESPRGPLPLGTTLDYARQVANALDAAHEKGIVHRDLKPGNIKVRPDGTVKVLDFGLAKVAPVPQSPAGDPAAVSMRATQVGKVLGTPAYMSPEQVRGYDVDKRADIWAFGVLLCELLTGVTPFDQKRGSDTTVAAVLTAEPDIVSVPLEIQWLVRKCLDKDPQKRLRDIGDAWDLLGRPDATIVARPSSRFRRAGWIVLALLVVSLASITWNGFPSRVPDDKPAVRLDVDLGAGVSIDGTGLANLVISPDGTRLAYVSHDRLFTQRFDETRPNELTSVEGATAPFFSPDGQWIGFFGYGKLRKVSVNGGLPVDLWTMTSGYRAGASWGEDGNIIAPLSSTGPLLSISSAGGSPGPLHDTRPEPW